MCHTVSAVAPESIDSDRLYHQGGSVSPALQIQAYQECELIYDGMALPESSQESGLLSQQPDISDVSNISWG